MVIKNRFLLLLLWVSSSLAAQQRLSLTREQMYADFDTLVYTIKRVSPHLPVKKDLWQYDALQEMKKARKSIDTVSSDLSYFIVLQTALNLAQDMHTSLHSQENEWAQTQYNAYRKIRNGFKLSIGNKYINGEYTIIDPFVVQGDTIEIGAVVTHINGEKVDKYLKKHLGSTYGITYDLARRKFYYPGFFRNSETIFQEKINFTFQHKDGRSATHEMPTHEFTKYLPSTRYKDTTRVELWQEERLLYIRLTDMEPDYTAFILGQLSAMKSQMQGVNKIIIDIRDNPGGQDNAWTDLLAALIDQPLSWPLVIDDYKNSAMTKEKIESHGYSNITITPDNNPLLRKYHFNTILNTTETLEPSPTSLHFKGKIFLLAEDHYSSAGSAVSVACANPKDNLIALGRKTNYFLGIGFSPLVFTLPHSKMRYRIAPSIEVTNVAKLSDLMHDRMEIEVPEDLDYYQKKFEYKGQPTEKAFMLKHDPFIKAVLAH